MIKIVINFNHIVIMYKCSHCSLLDTEIRASFPGKPGGGGDLDSGLENPLYTYCFMYTYT